MFPLKTTTDPIVALESLGYTRREAAFLYLVAVHSGYFLRRQFDYFIDRVKGHLAQHFLEKARVAGHVEVLDYGQGRHVYHLFFKPIYRLLGEADSQNRRRKGDAAIRGRLISLDYVLGHENNRYLESTRERLHLCSEVRRIPMELFADQAGRLHPLLASFPVALADRERPDTSLVKFVFSDEALITVEKFIRFLTVAEPLLRALGNFEIVYVSNSAQNFPAALKEFKKKFPPEPANYQPAFAPDWRSPDEHFPETRANRPPLQAKFTTLLLDFSYPKLRRSEGSSPSTSQCSGLSARR